MVNRVARAVGAFMGLFYLVAHTQTAEAPSLGPDLNSLKIHPPCSVENNGLEKLISEDPNRSKLDKVEKEFKKFQSDINRYDLIASKNPFFAEIYSVWGEKVNRRWTPEELYAIFWVESKGNLRANSHTKPEPALGPFQILESSWDSVPPYINYFPNVYKLKPSTEKAINLLNSMYDQASVLYPNWDKLTLNEQKQITLRTYNTGIGHYQQANWIVDNLSKQTQEYVPRIVREMIRNNFDTDSFLSKRSLKESAVF